MTRLVLWRHGLTDYNVAGRIQGRVDIPLNDAGLAQASAVAPAIAAMEPTAIVSSPLGRARQTADVLSAAVGVDVRVDDALMERSFGMWEDWSASGSRGRGPISSRCGGPGGIPRESGSRRAATPPPGSALRWRT